MKSVIHASSVALEFPNGRELFGNVTVTLRRNITALVGPNGVGKTCLARLLAGELQPTRGMIRQADAVALFPQREEPPSSSIEEYLATGYGWSLWRERLLAGLHRQVPCTTLSGGQWMRVRLARLLNDSYIILDEPTNDLDRDGRRAVLQFLNEHRGGVFLISHDRECLQLCQEVLELSRLGLSRFGMGWEAYLNARERERSNAAIALDTAKGERDRALAGRVQQKERQAKRNRQGARAAAKSGMPPIQIGAHKRRAETTTGKIEVATLDRAQRAVTAAYQAFQEIKVDPVMYAELGGREIAAQKLVAEARGFNVAFQGWLYPEDLSFCWRGCLRIALKGGNGTGKTTLLKAVLGQTFQTRGQLRRGDLATLYIDQRCAQLDDNKSVLENVREVSAASDCDLRNGLAKLLFAGQTVAQKVAELSGGERLRAALARGLLSNDKPELLVLDEPTNNLDLVNIEFLEGLVREFRGAILVISHDEIFLRNCGITEELEVALPAPGSDSNRVHCKTEAPLQFRSRRRAPYDG